MNATKSIPAPIPPTLDQLRRLADLCSDAEWSRLVGSQRFLVASGDSLGAMENFMSERLGRKISLSKPSVSNPGDASL